MAAEVWTTFGDLQEFCRSLDERIDDVIEKTSSGSLSKSRVQELLRKISIAAVLEKGDCGWIAEEDRNLVQITGVACIKEKQVFFEDPSVAEYLLATAVVNRLYNFAPYCAEIDGLKLGRILAEDQFARLRCFINWKIGRVSINTRNISAETSIFLKNLHIDQINLAFLIIQVENLVHLDKIMSEAGLQVVVSKNTLQYHVQEKYEKNFWAYLLSYWF